jgi:hypothetical protein
VKNTKKKNTKFRKEESKMPKVEMLRTYNNEQIKKLNLEELQIKFLELQEIAKDGNIIIQKLQYEKDLNNKVIDLMLDDLDVNGYGKEALYNSYRNRVRSIMKG